MASDHTRGRSTVGPSEETWDEMKSTIHRLYITERKTLMKVASIMKKDHDFYATTKLYTAHFSKWGAPFAKNKTKDRPETLKYVQPRSRKAKASIPCQNRAILPWRPSPEPSHTNPLSGERGSELSAATDWTRPGITHANNAVILQAPLPILHVNDTSRHLEMALHGQLGLTTLFMQDTGSSSFSFKGVYRANLCLKCALLHIDSNLQPWSLSWQHSHPRSRVHFGRFVREAVTVLQKELLDQGRARINAVVDVSLNVLQLLFPRGLFALSILVLECCLGSFPDDQREGALGQCFQPILSFYRSCVKGLDQGQDRGGNQALESLRILSSAHEQHLRENRKSLTGSQIDASRRCVGLTQDLTPSSSPSSSSSSSSSHSVPQPKEGAREVIRDQEALLDQAREQHGRFHPDTLRVENQLFRLQHRAGETRELASRVSKAERDYINHHGSISFASWREPEQGAYLRYLERLFDIYVSSGEPEMAYSYGKMVRELVGCRDERRLYFMLRVETWLRDAGFADEAEASRREREESQLYSDLARRDNERSARADSESPTSGN